MLTVAQVNNVGKTYYLITSVECDFLLVIFVMENLPLNHTITQGTKSRAIAHRKQNTSLCYEKHKVCQKM